MARKTLRKMEYLRGFVQIPSKNRAELIGDVALPYVTTVNGSQARLDKYGRLWSPSLKERIPPGATVEIIKNGAGYNVYPVEIEQRDNFENADQKNKTKTSASNLGKEEHVITAKPYFHVNSICIFQDDILKTEAVAKESIDLIITSPPYGVDIKYKSYNDNIPYSNYLDFTREWLTRCLEFVKDDGRLCLNIPLDKNKGGQQSVYADIITIAKNVGWKYHTTIIWNEQNISRRTAWGSWLSASAPFVIAPVEVIAVLYKKRWKKTSGSGKSDITRTEFLEWTNGVWNFSGESKNKIGHPSPYPIELPKRCIKLFSFVGDTILDPFLGSGTTLIACLLTGRSGIGVEIDENYCELAVKRLKEYGIEQKKLIIEGDVNGQIDKRVSYGVF